jgi:myosin heavy subunit
MSEIKSFIDPKAEKQVEQYKKDIADIAKSYKTLATNADKLEKEQAKQAKTQEELDNATKAYNGLLKQLNTNAGKLEVAESNLNREVIKQREALRKANAETKATIQLQNAEAGSINQLTARNKTLRTERNKLNLTTEAGRRKLKELNAEINKNDKAIKSNNDELVKSKINVGNYQSALDGLGGGLGRTVQGFMSMTRASMAFIATPIGAVIGALGLAIGALTKFFNGSEKGQNAFNRVAKIGGVILGNLTDIVISVGEAIFNAFSNPQQAISDLWEAIKTNIVNRFEGMVMQFQAIGKILKGAFDLDFDAIKEGAAEFGDATIQAATGIEDAIGKTTAAVTGLIEETQKEIEVAGELADLEAKRDLMQRKLIVDQEKLRAKSRELRLQAEQAEGEERIRLLSEAFAIEDELARRRTEIAAINLKVKTEENKLNESTKEDLDEQAELEAELFRIQQDRLKLQRTLQTQINTETEKALALQNKQAEQYSKIIDEQIAKDDEAFEAEQARLDAEIDADIERQLIKEENEVLANENKKVRGQKNLQNLAELTGKETALNKVGAVKQAVIDGKAAVQSAFADTPGPLPIKIAAAAIAAGIQLKNVKDIIGTSVSIPAFADGTDSTPGGQFLAGEAGRELMIDQNGNAMMIDKPTIFTNQAGNTILSNPDTEKVMRGNKPNKRNIDTDRIVGAIQENKAQMSVMLDKYGIVSVSRNGQSRTKYLNRKFRNKA